MEIGLIAVDEHSNYPNLALMKLSAYHKAQGDNVEWAQPLDLFTQKHYDIIYASKVFTFTKDVDWNQYSAEKIIKGGTGYSNVQKMEDLPEAIDRLQPDYALYNITDLAYGFVTRGCPNKCPWCIVPKKEGAVRPYMTIDEIAQGNNTKNVILMDNNILAHPYGLEQLRIAAERGYKIDLNQGMDARLVTDEIAELLASCKWLTYIRLACDKSAQIPHLERAMQLLEKHGYHKEIFVYTLLQDFKESYSRLKWIYSHKGKLTPHCQGYIDFSGKKDIPQWQKDVMRWANIRMLYKSCWVDDYEPRKGFKFKEYLKMDL